ncbi:phosphatase PAP2 family protein [Streptomyces sp. NBC_01190]|uniref:phosphatase PAP2 family protein n=1 Tax=Streptomyces sp. NBC_01190 TaxID=2903767 RepID=UPI00386BE02E|nr:phosphatase PAP2 family protein [Streptomyces sp. NBC_01190]
MSSAPLAFDGSHIDGGLYTDTVDVARHSPQALGQVVEAWSTYGLGVFAVLMLMAWWGARRGDPAVMARALAAPLIVALVLALDTVLKSQVQEVRPCRTIPGSFTLEACPAAGDWSFPSNHTIVAFTAAAALWATDRRLGRIGAVAAVAMGLSRIFVGVHYPHDVLAAAVLGVALGIPLTRLSGRAAPLITSARTGPLRPLVEAR